MKLSLYPLALIARKGRAWIDDWTADYPQVTLRVREHGRPELKRVVKVGSREHIDFISALEAAQF